MSRIHRSKRRNGTNTASNAAPDAAAWRSNQTARAGSDSRHHDANPESDCAAGHTTNKPDRAAGNANRSSFAAHHNAGESQRAGNESAASAFGNATANGANWRA